MNLSILLNRCESGDLHRYDGHGEIAFAAIASLLWFSASWIRLSLGGESWTLAEKCLEAGSFVLFAGIPIFGLATLPGARFAQRVLLKNDGLWFQTISCVALWLYIGMAKFVEVNPGQFRFLNQLENLVFAQNFGLNTVLFLLGAFAALRIPFLMLRWRTLPYPKATGDAPDAKSLPMGRHPVGRQSQAKKLELMGLTGVYLLYLMLAQTAWVSPALKTENSGFAIAGVYACTLLFMALPISQKTTPDRLMPFDLGLSALAIYSIFCFTRPMMRCGVFIPVVLFIVVVIYGLGLGREHFGYSFQVRQSDVIYTGKLIAIAILLLVPTAFALGFVSPKLATAVADAGGWAAFVLRLISFAILFSFRVGVFEEVLFRSGLLIFIRDQLAGYAHAKDQQSATRPSGPTTLAERLRDRRTLLLTAALICSLIFGLAHLGNSPSADSFISFWQYKIAYLLLATLASLFYSLAFVETNRLWSSIVIHGFVDTTAVVLLGAELVVPF
jgi:hypothetical protein